MSEWGGREKRGVRVRGRGGARRHPGLGLSVGGGPARRGAAGDSWSGEISSGLIGLERIREATRRLRAVNPNRRGVESLGVRVGGTLNS
jgi:hypothetical protein